MWATLFIGTLVNVWERVTHFLEQIYSSQVSEAHG